VCGVSGIAIGTSTLGEPVQVKLHIVTPDGAKSEDTQVDVHTLTLFPL